jgi:hypothetical protein
MPGTTDLEPSTTRQVIELYPRTALSATAAVRDVEATLRWLDAPEDVIEAAAALVDELVTHALTAARTGVMVAVTREDDRVAIEVVDFAPRRPITPPGVPTGQTLPLTATLAGSWGVSTDERTKRVWLTLPTGGR